MVLTRKSLLAIVFAVVALFLLAAVQPAEASVSPGFFIVEDDTELVADTATTFEADVNSYVLVLWRSSELPGGVYAIGAGSSNAKVTTRATEVPPGGAVGHKADTGRPGYHLT